MHLNLSLSLHYNWAHHVSWLSATICLPFKLLMFLNVSQNLNGSDCHCQRKIPCNDASWTSTVWYYPRGIFEENMRTQTCFVAELVGKVFFHYCAQFASWWHEPPCLRLLPGGKPTTSTWAPSSSSRCSEWCATLCCWWSCWAPRRTTTTTGPSWRRRCRPSRRSTSTSTSTNAGKTLVRNANASRSPPRWLPLTCAPPAVRSGEVQKRRRGHVHRQDLQAEHALDHQEVQPRQQPPQAPDGHLAAGAFPRQAAANCLPAVLLGSDPSPVTDQRRSLRRSWEEVPAAGEAHQVVHPGHLPVPATHTCKNPIPSLVTQNIKACRDRNC